MNASVIEAESRFRIMADTAPVMMWMSGADRGCDWFNAGWLRFTGRPMVRELGFGWAEGIHPADRERCMATYFAAFEAGAPFQMEYRLHRHDECWRVVLDHGTPRFDGDGRLVGYIGCCVDVHERHEHEATVKAMLRERDVLLREVHHRVRNNFQLVMSMIGLRHGQLEAESAEGVVLRELQSRIGIMSAIQDELVSQPHADRIDFAGQLRRLMASMDDGRFEQFAEIEALEVPVDRALPLALIAAELLSNIYKHAAIGHPEGGRLWVSLQSVAGTVVLTMRDNGPGIPPPLARPRTVGLQIVRALAAQADGAVEVDTAPSSTVRVRLKALA